MVWHWFSLNSLKKGAERAGPQTFCGIRSRSVCVCVCLCTCIGICECACACVFVSVSFTYTCPYKFVLFSNVKRRIMSFLLALLFRSALSSGLSLGAPSIALFSFPFPSALPLGFFPPPQFPAFCYYCVIPLQRTSYFNVMKYASFLLNINFN